MKDTLFAVIFICGLFGGQALAGDPDIYARPAFYVGGTLVKDNQMNKDAKYTTPDKPLEVTTADSYYQKDGKYYFKIGYFLNIRREKEALSTVFFYNSISYGGNQDLITQIKPKPEDKNIVGYSNGIWIMAIHGSIILKEGENNITLKLDSGSNIKETNEQNNVYNFKVTFKK